MKTILNLENICSTYPGQVLYGDRRWPCCTGERGRVRDTTYVRRCGLTGWVPLSTSTYEPLLEEKQWGRFYNLVRTFGPFRPDPSRTMIPPDMIPLGTLLWCKNQISPPQESPEAHKLYSIPTHRHPHWAPRIPCRQQRSRPQPRKKRKKRKKQKTRNEKRTRI